MNLIKSIFNVQHACPKISKTNNNDFGKYKYADLVDIMNVLKPLLFQEKLFITQKLHGNSITTTVCHVESGERDEFETVMHEIVQLKGMNNYQVDGSRITYYKKYIIVSYFGLISDEESIDALPPQPTEPPAQPKKKLTENQFDRLLIALDEGAEINLNDYNFTEDQKSKLPKK